jgi:hypothetical protein
VLDQFLRCLIATTIGIMDDLDELLKGLDNPRASARPSHRTPSAAVNYDELNELMQDLASPVGNIG